jgi:hypothetical protein
MDWVRRWRLNPLELPGTHCTGEWVGARVGLGGRRKSQPPEGFDPRTVQLVASGYTAWAIPVHYWTLSSTLKKEYTRYLNIFYYVYHLKEILTCFTVCKRPTNAQGSSGFFISTFQILYPVTFRHMVAILRRSWVPEHMLVFCKRYYKMHDSTIKI